MLKRSVKLPSGHYPQGNQHSETGGSSRKNPGIVRKNEKQLGICGICEENEILLKNSLQTGGFCDILTKLFIGVR